MMCGRYGMGTMCVFIDDGGLMCPSNSLCQWWQCPDCLVWLCYLKAMDLSNYITRLLWLQVVNGRKFDISLSPVTLFPWKHNFLWKIVCLNKIINQIAKLPGRRKRKVQDRGDQYGKHDMQAWHAIHCSELAKHEMREQKQILFIPWWY
jgi:hypothetical protein